MSLNADVLRSSLELVLSREDTVTERFYEILFERYPQAKPLFGHNAADAQAKMLQEAIVAVVDHLEDEAWLGQTLGGLGRTHVDYGVTEEMFPWVGECLLAALAAAAGDAWNDEIEQAWTEAYGAIAGLMLEGYRAEVASRAEQA